MLVPPNLMLVHPNLRVIAPVNLVALVFLFVANIHHSRGGIVFELREDGANGTNFFLHGSLNLGAPTKSNAYYSGAGLDRTTFWGSYDGGDGAPIGGAIGVSHSDADGSRRWDHSFVSVSGSAIADDLNTSEAGTVTNTGTNGSGSTFGVWDFYVYAEGFGLDGSDLTGIS